MSGTLSTTPSLAGCPKCDDGGNPYPHAPGTGMVNIRCSDCGHEGPTFTYSPEKDLDDPNGAAVAEKKAARAWNRESHRTVMWQVQRKYPSGWRDVDSMCFERREQAERITKDHPKYRLVKIERTTIES